MDNFTLFILEFTDENSLLEREQFYLDKFQPMYNILTKANNSVGFTYSKEFIEKKKIRDIALGRTQSLKVRKAMSENRKGLINNFYGKKTHTW